ncbi:MAG: MTH1187 family thiamine-binding protein [Synergistales bacterium]|nr:MTH1187 family thiamine-binding protein [Synergistales bacterium]
MAQVIAELVVVPLGTATPSVSRYVAEVEAVLEASPLKVRLTPMGTILEGRLEDVLEAVRQVHELPFSRGALRVATTLRIDERRDRELTMEGKMQAVETKMER